MFICERVVDRVFLSNRLSFCEAWFVKWLEEGDEREGGSETHSISAILSIHAHVLPEVHRDAMDKMGDFFRGSKR
jgi:hypothetical protein